jgi:GR25 family glycosyltransferase involved in LPS biosynthesis
MNGLTGYVWGFLIVAMLVIFYTCYNPDVEYFDSGKSCIKQLESYDIYLINLDRNPARLEAFVDQYYASDMKSKPFKRISAVDGKTLDISQFISKRAYNDIRQIEKTGYRTKHYQITRGAIGCYLSHMKAYKYISESDLEYGLIFEDDVIIDKNFRLKMNKVLQSIPNDWDMLLLGCICIDCDKHLQYSNAHKFFLLHCYIVKKTSAKFIHTYLDSKPIEQQVDSELSDMITAGKLIVYCVNDNICWQGQTFATDIQTPIKVIAGIDPYVTV